MNVLVVAAHPDDEVLGCGGTIARLADQGHKVYIAVLGEGITSRFAERDQVAPAAVKDLRARSREAAGTLGARDIFFHDLPDNRFDTTALLDVVKIIESLVARFEPEVVYTHHGGDLNVDHACTHRASLTATRPLAGDPVKAVYAYEVASSTDWAFQQFSPAFLPNTFVDISRTLERKIAAMQAYAGEVRPFPHPRSPEALRAVAARWGSVAGLRAAEAFQLVRAVK